MSPMSATDFQRVIDAINRGDGKGAVRLAAQLPGRMTEEQRRTYDAAMSAMPAPKEAPHLAGGAGANGSTYVDYMGERCLQKEKDVEAGYWRYAAILGAVATVGILPYLASKSEKESRLGRYYTTLTENTVKETEYEISDDVNETINTLGYDPNNEESVEKYYATHAGEALSYRGGKYLITMGGRVIVDLNGDGKELTHMTFVECNKSDERKHGQPIVDTAENRNELTRLVKSWMTNRAKIEKVGKNASTYLFDYNNKNIYTISDDIDVNDKEALDPSNDKFRGKKLEFKNAKTFWHGVVRLKDKDDEMEAERATKKAKLSDGKDKDKPPKIEEPAEKATGPKLLMPPNVDKK